MRPGVVPQTGTFTCRLSNQLSEKGRMMIADIASQAPLDADEIRRAAARSVKLANILRNAREMGFDVSVIRIPQAAQPVQGEQADG